MKKSYIAPTTCAVNIQTEGHILSASDPKVNNTVGNGAWFSDKEEYQEDNSNIWNN